MINRTDPMISIDFIKGRDDITSDEKESLLMGLSVAWHSFCYWKEKYNWNQ